MIFSISSLRSKKSFFVGVLEFTAPEDSVLLPDWLFRNLKIGESEMIRIGYCTFLPKANFCKIQPHKTAFIDLPDPKTILEIELRNFICLNLNDTITIEFNGKSYDLDILEIKPETSYKAAVIIDTDMNLDFAPPKDYVEPVRQRKNSSNAESSINYSQFKRIDGKTLKKKQKKMIEQEELAKDFDPRKHKIPNGIRKNCLGIFSSFKGQGVKLGG
jgi:ubiquitin fusion degradation protein 1